MSKRIEFELNSAGVRELLQSDEMRDVIEEATNRVQSAASSSGKAFEGDVKMGRKRVVGMVRAGDAAAYYDNLEHNTLLKALSATRKGGV